MYQKNPLMELALVNVSKLKNKLRIALSDKSRFFKDADGILQKRGFPYQRSGYNGEYLELVDYIKQLKDLLGDGANELVRKAW